VQCPVSEEIHDVQFELHGKQGLALPSKHDNKILSKVLVRSIIQKGKAVPVLN
jgi:hypothetical protein